MKFKPFVSLLTLLSVLLMGKSAYADYARPWQLDFQEAATPVMQKLSAFHNDLLYIITGITLFVLFLLIYVCVRFSKKANPQPTKTSHNTLLEIIWTSVPVIILVMITIPSLKILYYENKVENPEMTLKVVGHQWYWEYQYAEEGGFGFDSYMIKPKDLKPGQRRLLDVDNRVVLPENTNIRVLITAADVMHSWAMPAAGIKTDAVPGRVNETWLNFKHTGVYYGQCSELCGVDHGFMPIAIEVVTKEEYTAWVKQAKKKFAGIEAGEKFALSEEAR